MRGGVLRKKKRQGFACVNHSKLFLSYLIDKGSSNITTLAIQITQVALQFLKTASTFDLVHEALPLTILFEYYIALIIQGPGILRPTLLVPT